MNLDGGADPAAILVLFGIWSVVAIAFYVWYLWALSRLFPRIGLPASHGWIPIWNQWQLVERAGLPGWLVLFALLPGLGLVAFVVTVIAIHRINNEYDRGAGFTVLGAIIPQVWAMLLTSHIDQTGHGVMRQGSAPSQGSVPNREFMPGQAYTPPGYTEAATPQFARDPQPGYPAPRPDLQHQQHQQHQAPYVQAPPVSGARAAAPEAPQQSNIDALFGAPAPHQDLPPVPPQGTGTAHVPTQSPSGPDSGAVRITPVGRSQFGGAYDPAGVTPPQQPHTPSQPGQAGSWGFSNTTEDAFERLAAEGAGRPAESPLGYMDPPRPFSWPEQHASPIDDQVTTPPAAREAPHEHRPDPDHAPAPHPGVPEPGAPEPSVRDQAAPVPAQPVVPQPTAPQPVAPQSAAPQPVAPAAPAIFSTGERDTQRPTNVPDPAPASAVQAPPASSVIDDDEDDRTVVVPRRKRWGLELPSGDVEELVGDDVVIGRRPEGPDGVTLLKIADPTRTLSKSHVRMRRVNDDWTVEDLQSTNGVSIDSGNGARVIEAGREVRATPHMVIGTLEVKLREIG